MTQSIIQLNQKIIKIYPELNSSNFSITNISNWPYILQDDSDGKGVYIKKWNYSKPQPTQTQLDAIK